MGQGDIDVHRLLRNPTTTLLLHVLDRSHVMQSIRQLDQQDSDVLRHRDQHLAKVLRLLLPGATELNPRDLSETLHQEGHPVAKQTLNLAASRQRIFEGVVEESGNDRVFVDVQVEQDACHLERMDQVGLAR